VRPFDLAEGPPACFGQIKPFTHPFLHQMDDDFRVCVRGKLVAFGLELFPQRQKILHNAVLDDSNFAGAVHMRVRVLLVGLTMGCPACVANSNMAVDRPALIEVYHKGLTLARAEQVLQHNQSRYADYMKKINQPDDRKNQALFNAFMLDCQKSINTNHVATYASHGDIT